MKKKLISGLIYILLMMLILSCESRENPLLCTSVTDKVSATWILKNAQYEPLKLTEEFREFKDLRDGNMYKAVKIGYRWWMTEDLRFGANKFNQNIQYTYEEACNVCPNGWRLISSKDWVDLNVYLDKAGKHLNETSISINYNGFFDFEPWGGSKFRDAGKYGYYWLAGSLDAMHPPAIYFDQHREYFASLDRMDRLSVRCVSDGPMDELLNLRNQQIYKNEYYSSFIDDRDGKTYFTVKIGEQTWMAENLNFITEQGSWGIDYYNDLLYGRLYSYEAAINACPDGWRLPNRSDLEALVQYLGGACTAGGKMKASGIDFWDIPNHKATNSSGFTALPAGRGRINKDTISEISRGGVAEFWFATSEISDSDPSLMLSFLLEDFRISGYTKNFWANSIRCIKDE